MTQQGNKVIVSGHSDDKNSALVQQTLTWRAIHTDVSDPESIKDTATWLTVNHPELSVLINSTGVMRKIDLEKPTQSLSSVTQELDTNTRGTVQMSYALIDHLRTQTESAIIAIPSGRA